MRTTKSPLLRLGDVNIVKLLFVSIDYTLRKPVA